MSDKYSVGFHTAQELERAKSKGQMIGWAQGAVVTFVGLLLLNLIGWIPTLLILVLVGLLGFKLLTKGKEG